MPSHIWQCESWMLKDTSNDKRCLHLVNRILLWLDIYMFIHRSLGLCLSCQNFNLHSSMYYMLDAGSKQLPEILLKCALILQSTVTEQPTIAALSGTPGTSKARNRILLPRPSISHKHGTPHHFHMQKKEMWTLVSQGAHLSSSNLFMTSKLQLCRVLSLSFRK